MSTTDMAETEIIAQRAAELLYQCATANDCAASWSRSPLYQAAEAMHREAMRTAFGLSETELDAARDLLAEYGPHDGAYGTSYPDDVRGIAILAREQVAERHAADAERSAVDEVPWSDEDTEVHVMAARDGSDAGHTAYLSERQIGAYTRHLGPGWTVRRTSWIIPAADDARTCTVATDANGQLPASWTS